MKVYIAGPITGNPDYMREFAEAERRLLALGHGVMNPAWVRETAEFSYEDYRAVSQAMLERCDAICLLPGWEGSRGAREELAWAKERGFESLFGEEETE